MLIRIGPSHGAGDVVDALLECHERIRAFTDLALRLAVTAGLSAAEVRDAAASVHRYFSVALPLHARDEEESVLPRLLGKDARVDRELAEMQREHAEHGGAVSRVLAACAELKERPEALPRIAPGLADAARELAHHFEAHLAREERGVFPAVHTHLDRDTRAAVHAEMRARRGAAVDPAPG